MPIGEKHKSDCVFKKRDGGKIICSYPKMFKMCYGCNCYIKNDGDIDKIAKYITLVVTKKSSNLALKFSFISLLISFASLYIKVKETKELNIAEVESTNQNLQPTKDTLTKASSPILHK